MTTDEQVYRLYGVEPNQYIEFTHLLSNGITRGVEGYDIETPDDILMVQNMYEDVQDIVIKEEYLPITADMREKILDVLNKRFCNIVIGYNDLSDITEITYYYFDKQYDAEGKTYAEAFNNLLIQFEKGSNIYCKIKEVLSV